VESRTAEGEKDGELADGSIELRIVLLGEEGRAQHERTRQDQE